MIQSQKNKRFSLMALILFLLVFWGFEVRAKASSARDEEIEKVETAIQVIREIVELPEEGVPEALLRKAQGIAIIPGVIKAAYGIGGQYGKGIVMVRGNEGIWSNPCFITLAGGSIGWQIGVQRTDIVLVFKSAQSVENITQGKITFGADLSVTAGPVGRRAEASTDLDFKAEIYSYSKSKGLFAGVSIQGASISIDHEANRNFYEEKESNARDILSGKIVKAPSVATRLVKLVERYTKSGGYV